MAGTGTIPRAFIDDLITRIDIVDLIDSYIPLKRTGRNFVACCPFHQEKSPSFNVSQTKQFYHCFGCGASGNVISFMMNHRNLEFLEAIDELAARAGVSVPRENVIANPISQDLYTLLSQVAQHYHKQLYHSSQALQAREYLKKRGLSEGVIQDYQLGYALDAWNNLSNVFPKMEKALIATGMLVEKSSGRPYDQYRDRIMFPIHDRRGRIIGFGGRVLDAAKQPKYINSPETTLFHKSKALYGLYQASQKNPHPDYLFIVEGYMDVIALAQHGIPQAVAALGTATTRDHVQSLLRYTKHLVFCFDGDNAGRKAAWKALESALPYLDAQAQFDFMFLPDGEDPDSLIRKEGQAAFIERIKTAKSLDVFFFEELTRSLDLSAMADCSKLIESSKSYFAWMPVCAYRDLMLEKLARFSRMNITLLEKQLKGDVSEEKTSGFSTPPKKTLTRTNARLALSLLIQHPELIENVHSIPSLESLNPKGGKILYDIMTVLKAESMRSTGGLLEYYREHEYYEWITQLAIFPHNVPPDGLKEEFLGALQKMQREHADRKIKTILQRKQATDFSDEERRALLAMIQKNKKNHP